MNEEKTIFERIVLGELPSHKVYEDEKHFAFLTIEPASKGHTLVITKHPYRNILEMPDTQISEYFVVVAKLAKIIKNALNADGVNIFMNNEPAAGQEVFHAHVHIIPRHNNDGVIPSINHLKYKDGEQEEIISSIVSLLSPVESHRRENLA